MKDLLSLFQVGLLLRFCIKDLLNSLQSPHNDIRYEIAGSRKANEFFLINEVTGEIYIKKPLSEDNEDVNSYTVS